MSSDTPGTGELRAAIRRLRAELAQGKTRFPVLDPRVAELHGLLARADVSVDETAELVMRDPALAASVLRAANSAFYRRGSADTTNVRDACVRLGTRRVLAIAIEAATQRSFAAPKGRYGETMRQLWRASVVGSRLAARLAGLLRRFDADELQVAALFHNAGEMLLVQLVADLPGAEAFDDAEVAALVSRLHEDFGRALTQAWGLPRVFVGLAACHHRPAAEPEPPEVRVPRLVVLASWQLALEAGHRALPGEEEGDARETLAALGLPPDAAEPLLEEARQWEV